MGRGFGRLSSFKMDMPYFDFSSPTYQQLDKQSPEESTNFKKNASAEKREPNSKATDSMSSTHSKQAASISITHSNQATLESIGNLKKVESPV
ncbi:hypothetical protein YC2023_033652 [Brassica napus]